MADDHLYTPEYILEAQTLVTAVKNVAFTSPIGMFASQNVKDEESAKQALVALRKSLRYYASRTIELEEENRRLKDERQIVRNFFKGAN